MSILSQLVPVRYYLPDDVYFYAIDNRPLQDLTSNITFVATSLDALASEVQDPYEVDTGTANTYITQLEIPMRDGLSVSFKALNPNNGPSTYSSDGVHTYPLYGSDGNPLVGGEIVGGAIYSVVLDLTAGIWRILGQTDGAQSASPGLQGNQLINYQQYYELRTNFGADSNPTPQPNMLWADNTTNTLWIRNSANTIWLKIGDLNVQGLGRPNNSVVLVSTSTTLSSAQAGALVECGGTTDYIVSLPSPVGLTGTCYNLVSTNSSQFVIATPTGVFVVPYFQNLVNFPFNPGDSACFVSDGTNWVMQGYNGQSIPLRVQVGQGFNGFLLQLSISGASKFSVDQNGNVVASGTSTCLPAGQIDQSVIVQQVVQNDLVYATDTGTANAYVVTRPVKAQQYVDGMLVRFTAANTNTGGSATINVDGLGAVTLLPNYGSFEGNEILAGGQYEGIYYAAANQVRLLSQSAGHITQPPAEAANHVTTLSQFPLDASGYGHASLPGGLIIQWGSSGDGVTPDTSGTSAAVVWDFPIPFPNACLTIVATDQAGGAHSMGISPLSTSQAQAWGAIGSTYSSTIFHWLAIGF